MAWRPKGSGITAHPASMFVLLCLFFYALCLLFGVPLLVPLRRRGWSSLRAYALAGMALVLPPTAAGLAWVAAYRPLPIARILLDLLYWGLSGSVTGALLWLIARPDRAARRKALAAASRISETFE